MTTHGWHKRNGRSAMGRAAVLVGVICGSSHAADRAGGPRAYPEPPAWVAGQTLYEVNLRQFSPGGDLAGLVAQLPRLKAMGVGTLWIMPVNPIGHDARSGTLGSPYAPKDYTAINPEFGTIAQFKAAVDAAHRLGLHVVLDWVAVHTAPDHPWVKAHPDWYKHDADGRLVHPMPEWKDVVALDYDAPGLRRAMSDAMAYWVRDVGVDGFRCDTAEWVPLDFWCDVRDRLRAIKPVFMLAEGAKPQLMQYAFDSAYAWNLPENTQGLVAGTKSVADLCNYLNADARLVPPGRFRLNFTSNHDKNAWEGTTRDQLKDAADAMAVLTFTIPGMPLVFNGQENGVEHKLAFFDRDPIQWRDDPAAGLYRTLATLKREHAALRAGPGEVPLRLLNDPSTPTVLSFCREADGDRVVVMLNLGDKAVTLRPPGITAGLTETLTSDAGNGDRIGAWGYRVWATARRG